MYLIPLFHQYKEKPLLLIYPRDEKALIPWYHSYSSDTKFKCTHSFYNGNSRLRLINITSFHRKNSEVSSKSVLLPHTNRQFSEKHLFLLLLLICVFTNIPIHYKNYMIISQGFFFLKASFYCRFPFHHLSLLQ